MLVTKIQRFSTHDGPGIRTTVFLQGCSLNCSWCHNPETQSPRSVLIWSPRDCIGCGACITACTTGARMLQTEQGEPRLIYDRASCVSCGKCANVCPSGACEMSAREMTPEEVLHVILRDADFYETDGGVTLSGGEPLLRAEALELLRLCRRHGLHIAIETSGAVPKSHISIAAELADLLMYDIKDTNAERLMLMTGADMKHIVDNLNVAMSKAHGLVRLRCIMVKNVNMEISHYDGIANLYKSLENKGYVDHLEGVELIPYHAYAGSKACSIGRPDNGRLDWIPTDEDMQIAKDALTSKGVRVL